jgi:hypothetical protein
MTLRESALNLCLPSLVGTQVDMDKLRHQGIGSRGSCGCVSLSSVCCRRPCADALRLQGNRSNRFHLWLPFEPVRRDGVFSVSEILRDQEPFHLRQGSYGVSRCILPAPKEASKKSARAHVVQPRRWRGRSTASDVTAEAAAVRGRFPTHPPNRRKLQVPLVFTSFTRLYKLY